MTCCYYCGIQVYPKSERRNNHNYPLQTVDHVIPQCLTRPCVPSRTVVSCQECNVKKGALTIDEYRVVLAFRYGYISGVDFKFAAEL